MSRITRRSFLRHSSATVAATLAAGPLLVRANSPNGKLNIASIGVGGKGWSDMNSTSVGQNVTAICDIDAGSLAQAAAKYPQAKTYRDWRKLLEQKDIDACTISTPDHMHAPITMSAMRLGKGVYTQKPLTHSVHEARQLRAAARQYKVVTQMGNQGRSGISYRMMVKMIQDGAIGKVREVHCWTDRPSAGGIWPQGMTSLPTKHDDVPKGIEWDLWLGVAPAVPFTHGAFHPFVWRGWTAFGTGAQGDMGAHIVDPVLWALELDVPRRITSRGDEAPSAVAWPLKSIVKYEFAPTSRTADEGLTLHWYDGGNQPPRDLIPLPPDRKIGGNGSLYIGSEGTLLIGHNASGPQLFPRDKFRDYPRPQLEPHDHYMQWTQACLGEGKTSSSFESAAMTTETILLGNIALRYPGEALEWDAKAMAFTNKTEANQHLKREYRKGWEVEGLS